ncbi:hypothetical protein QCA50_004931 [Cerrena zonata]|uniref:Uncharacterized protein n=1 Tax=Cerrena zonata TaxID=2478898 RepID=A0AAW0GIA6_9APHY
MNMSRSYAAPVTKDNVFFYSDELYVEVTDGGPYSRHRYGRASPSRLYDLLTYEDRGPVLTKKGVPAKRQPFHKDETGHFYCAQLLHYGLKPLKTKAAAKKHLLAAFGSDQTLRVPDHIVQLENELKDLYARSNAQAKIRYENEKREREIAEKKRWEDLRKKQERIEADVVAASKPNVQATSKKRKSQNDGNSNPSKGRKKKNGEPSGSQNSDLTSLDLSGLWDIACPSLAEEYSGYSAEMTMKMSTSRGSLKDGHLWISFDFGVISGVMRCQALPLPANSTLSFEWRGSESGEGQMTFESINKGTITFLGNGKLKGVLNGDYVPKKNTPFFGTQNQENLRRVVWVKSVRQWKETWRGINANSYEVANQARWGKWVSDEGCDEDPADSDTTEAGGDSNSDSQPEYLSEEEDGFAF